MKTVAFATALLLNFFTLGLPQVSAAQPAAEPAVMGQHRKPLNPKPRKPLNPDPRKPLNPSL